MTKPAHKLCSLRNVDTLLKCANVNRVCRNVEGCANPEFLRVQMHWTVNVLLSKKNLYLQHNFEHNFTGYQLYLHFISNSVIVWMTLIQWWTSRDMKPAFITFHHLENTSTCSHWDAGFVPWSRFTQWSAVTPGAGVFTPSTSGVLGFLNKAAFWKLYLNTPHTLFELLESNRSVFMEEIHFMSYVFVTMSANSRGF